MMRIGFASGSLPSRTAAIFRVSKLVKFWKAYAITSLDYFQSSQNDNEKSKTSKEEENSHRIKITTDFLQLRKKYPKLTGSEGREKWIHSNDSALCTPIKYIILTAQFCSFISILINLSSLMHPIWNCQRHFSNLMDNSQNYQMFTV